MRPSSLFLRTFASFGANRILPEFLKPYSLTMLRSLCWALLLLPFSQANGADAPKTKPNIIIILTDDLGWSDVSFQGEGGRRTPNIQKLADDGMVFRNGYAASPVCSPSRVALLTGKAPARTGPTTILTYGDAKSKETFAMISPESKGADFSKETCLAAPLREAGYRTAYLGKGHFGERPEAVGFDDAIHWTKDNSQNRFPDKKTFMTDVKARAACEWITKHKDRPFFLHLNTHAVHVAYGAAPEKIRKYEAQGLDLPHAIYAAMIEHVDDLVGQIRSKLNELGIADKTVLVFSSDNGGVVPIARNAPLRGGKSSLLEGGIRVPFVVVWPGVTRPGSTSDALAVHTDLYPTFLEAAGLPLMPKQHMDGVSLLPALRGESMPEREFFWHYPHNNFSRDVPNSMASSMRRGKWKLIEFFVANTVELYDLDADIGEKRNLAGEQPEKVKELHDRLLAWRNETNAQLPKANPDYTPGIQRKFQDVLKALDPDTLKRLNEDQR